MADRWSRRERLLWLAKRLKLQVSLSISEDELQNLIDTQPATEKQFRYLWDFLGEKAAKLPKGLTYGEARNAIEVIKDDLNNYSIKALGLQEGQVRQWGDAYYFIFTILGSRRAYRVVVQEVQLTRDRDAKLATMKPKGARRTINPYRMLYTSILVDLAKWQPTTPKAHFDDEPDF